MTNNNLKIITASVISDSKLSKERKLEFFDFIQKKATDVQLKSLLLDGKIVVLDEDSEKIINERFKLSPYNDLIQEAAWLGIPIVGWAIGAVLLAKRFANKEKRKCGLMIGKKRKICLNKVNQKDLDNKIKLLKKLQTSTCKSTKDPLRCKEKAEDNIIKFKKKKADLASELVKIMSK